MGDSSSQLDSFATQIQTMTKKIQSVLNQMMPYSTPSGIDKLETTMKDLAKKGADKVKKIILEKVYMLSKKAQNFNLTHAVSLQQHQALLSDTEDPSEAFMKVKTTLDELQAVLPVVIDNLKFAKKRGCGSVEAVAFSI
jgi:paraquat-inducible protein B